MFVSQATEHGATAMKWCALILAVIGWASAATIQKPTQLLRNLHTLMDSDELNRFFGVDNSSRVDDYEVIYIRRHRKYQPQQDALHPAEDVGPRKRSPASDDNHAHYSFAAKGKDYNLKLKPNTFLIAPRMKTVVKGGLDGKRVIEEHHPTVDECHYLHVDDEIAVAISHCSHDEIHGYLIDGGQPHEIKPLTSRLRKMLAPPADEDEGSVLVGAHIIRPVDPASKLRAHAEACDADLPIRMRPASKSREPVEMEERPKIIEKRKSSKSDGAKAKAGHGKSVDGGKAKNALEKSITTRAANKVLELGIFVDQAALNLFMPYLGQKEYVKLRELVLAFVNGMQALYHLPSLGQRIDLSIVYMEFHAKPPAGFTNQDGERGKLLDDFCIYQQKINKPADSDPEHWDMALLLSGLDFYANEGAKKNYITMGLATVTGVCTMEYDCVIGEIGVTNQNGQPYPSTGFTSVYVMAHEIGHNLGMNHDSSGNKCPTDGFIMSPSRGVVGETQWSSCSASQLAAVTETCMNDLPTGNFPDYNHNKYGGKPGQLWSADEQCRVLLRDKGAVAFGDAADYCNSMKCKSPSRDGYFIAGPALPGTACGGGKWCGGGQCVPMTRSHIAKDVQGGWSDWKAKPCSSGCIIKSKGAVSSERSCDHPAPSDAFKRCVGPYVAATLCDDSDVCTGKTRPSASDYAGQQCAKFAGLVPIIDPKGEGMQAPYSPARQWQSCAIFCKRRDGDAFYSPRFELNNLPEVSAFFPDGTWCGNEDGKDLYCLQRSCVSSDKVEVGALTRSGGASSDFNILNNAPMTKGDHSLPESLKDYFTVDRHGRPVRDDIDPEALKLLELVHTGHEDDDFITIKPRH